MQRMNRLNFLSMGSALLFLSFIALAGCGGDDMPTTTDAALDASPDADSSPPLGDATADAMPDATADAAADAMPDATSMICPHCLEGELSWGWVGGFVAWNQVSSIPACEMYHLERTPSGESRPSMTCDAPISCAEDDATTMADVSMALAHSHVMRAFASGIEIFGRDMRFVDAPIYSITYGSNTVLVGSTCMGLADCVEPPEGLRDLVRFLQGLETAMITTVACADFSS